jgi:hypothetical protein
MTEQGDTIKICLLSRPAVSLVENYALEEAVPSVFSVSFTQKRGSRFL